MERSVISRLFLGVVVIAVGLVWLTPGTPRAFVAIDYQNPIERALGLKGMTALLLGPKPQRASRWRLEAGQRFLFGLADLRTTEMRATLRRQTWGATLSSSVLTAPVGRLATAAIEPFLWNGRVGVGAEVAVSTLAIDGLAGERMVAASAGAVTRVIAAFYLGYRIERIRLVGDGEPGADTTVYVAFLGGVGGVGEIRVRRTGDVELHVATCVQLTRVVDAAVGYDAATETIDAAISVAWSGISLGAGASVHPVLGVTKSVFVGWGR